jgi:hypothetical protein
LATTVGEDIDITLDISAPQHEIGSAPTAVQITGANGFDITEVPFRDVYYLAPDGVDDWMELAAAFAPAGAYTLAAAHDLYPAPNNTFSATQGIIFGRQSGDASKFFRGSDARLNIDRVTNTERISAQVSGSGRVVDYASVTNDTTRDFRRNGVAAVSYTAVDGTVLGIQLDTLFRTGSGYAVGLFYGGVLIESAITEPERLALQRYLASISGVTLA